MSNYSKRKGVLISVIVSIVIWISLNFILIQFQENQKKEVDSTFILKTSKTNVTTNINENVQSEIEKYEIINNQFKSNNWRIFISKINLN